MAENSDQLWRRVGVWRQGLRILVSLGLALGFGLVLADRISQIDAVALGLAFGQIAPGQWLAALASTALSFWAVGHYDAVVHRHFATSFDERATRRAGICAIAVSQTLGFGLISGAIIRWRMLPGLSLWQATRLTAAVALSFLAGWAVVASVTLTLLPAAPFKAVAGVTLTLVFLAVILCLAAPRWGFRWPNGITLARLIALTAIDSLAAAAAFHALCPAEMTLPFVTLLPAFLLALGAGLALGTPGGMGAFELTLLALLPMQPEALLLAATLGWRVVYYAMPAVIGAMVALKGPRQEETPKPKPHPPALRAESGLTAQGALELAYPAHQPWLLGRTGHCLIALLDPQGACGTRAIDENLAALKHQARSESLIPVIYKASARLAARARGMGMAPRRIGWEAWLTPQTFRLAASSRAGLRRKLRRAEAAGISVQHCPLDTAPWPALRALAEAWSFAHGGERGFSMGRFSKPYLSQQRLYIAWQGNQPIAFASFHTCPGEWTLDLMRHGTALPDGTMFTLIMAAIDDAARLGVARLSLAAVAEAAMGQTDRITRLIAVLAPQTAQTGLLRFKSAFAPNWSPLYLIAPNRPALALAGLSLWRAIIHPPPLMPEIERDHEEYEFASTAAPWHIARNR